MESLIKFGLSILAALIAISIHEYPKAVMAVFLGDETPRYTGKLSFNPFKHMDPIGFILLIAQNVGWAYPVEFNPNNFKDKKLGTIMVASIGIITSLAVAFVLVIIYGYMDNPLYLDGYSIYFKFFIQHLIYYSISISVFNLIPVPPLSITKIISIYSPRTYFKLLQYEKMLHIVFFMLYFLGIIPIMVNAISSTLFILFT